MSETPVHRRPRRLANWINPTDAKKVHSLIDKVYKRKNLEMAWEKVKANRGSGGIRWADSENIRRATRSAVGSTAKRADRGNLQAQPVMAKCRSRKAGKPGEFRTLGVLTIY